MSDTNHLREIAKYLKTDMRVEFGFEVDKAADKIDFLQTRVAELTEAVDDAWQVIASDESQYLRDEWLKKYGGER